MADHTQSSLLPTQSEVAHAVAVAAGRERPDVVFINARVVNVITQEIIESAVAVAGRLIAGVDPSYAECDAKAVVDLNGAYLAPGLIDGHLHVESSLVTPAAYAAAVVPRGVTGIVWDPHEIANVAGTRGLTWCMQASRSLPMSVWFDIPSCVPSTSLETAGARIGVAQIAELLKHPAVVGVGELMSFDAAIAGDPDVLARAFLGQEQRVAVDGHAPGISGRRTQAYLAGGVGSDHECTILEEAHEKLRAGAFLMIREGSATRNLKTLLPLLTVEHADRIGFVTDDRLPEDLLADGGVDCLVRYAIAQQVPPALAVRAASWNTARYFGLTRRGAVAPGFFADLIVLPELSGFRASAVYHEGSLVATGGALERAARTPAIETSALKAVRHSVTVPRVHSGRLEVPAPEGAEIRVIRPVAEQILTTAERMPATIRDGLAVADAERDLAKLVCVERHGHNGNIAVGFVTGFGMRSGAVAGTVAHDHHNVMAMGMNDGDISIAVERLGEIGGGFVVVDDGSVVAELALPVAGLLSESTIESVDAAMREVDGAARDRGITWPAVFMTLSFLGLPVIPQLRLTDHGLIDVDRGAVVPVVVDP